MSNGGAPWWADAVFYQIYPRSFTDGNGDGVGDLPGIRARLPYLRELGIDALWLSPFYRSPMADGGYDVADPCDVDPLFGTLADFDAMLADAHALGLKVTIDIVPNHFSDQHRWFRAALAAGPGSRERARFIFRPGRGLDGAEPPNNWPSVFGGSAWTRLPDGEWYLHLFAPEQPDLDWTNPQVPAEFDRILRFWLDRGVDGFRIDVAHGMAKPAGLPDMDLAEVVPQGEAGAMPSALDIRWDRDQLHDYLRGFRRTLDAYPDRMAVGEAWVGDAQRLARYVRPDELNLTFNFELVQAPWSATAMRDAIERSLQATAHVGARATWVLDNHDVDRAASRYGGGAVGLARARAAALLIVSLPGAAYLYNGDELGLENVVLPEEALQDPTWERSGHTDRGRDGERVPLPWSGTEPPYGFSLVQPAAPPWLPQPPDWGPLTATAQTADPDSTLWLYRRALALRTGFAGAEFAWCEPEQVPAECLGFRRDDVTVLMNLGQRAVPLPAGEMLLTSAPLLDVLPPNATVWARPAHP